MPSAARFPGRGSARPPPARPSICCASRRTSPAPGSAWQRLTGTYVENLPWLECAKRYDRPHTFFYMDPPYWQTEGYGVNFPFEQYERMAEL